jgi:hypothetical protein
MSECDDAGLFVAKMIYHELYRPEFVSFFQWPQRQKVPVLMLSKKPPIGGEFQSASNSNHSTSSYTRLEDSRNVSYQITVSSTSTVSSVLYSTDMNLRCGYFYTS